MFPQRVLILSVYLTLLGLRATSLPLSVRTTDVDVNNAAVSDTFIADGLVTREAFDNSDIGEGEADSEEYIIERRALKKTPTKGATTTKAAAPAASGGTTAKDPCANGNAKGKRADAACDVKKLPKVGDTITVAGKSLKLEKQLGPTPSVFQSGNFVVKIPRSTGEGAIQNLKDEIADTKKASEVLGSGLFVGEGVVTGVPVMVLKEVTGKSLDKISLGTGTDCETKFNNAVKLIKEQQTKLKDGAGFIQNDSNVDNFRFNDGVTELIMIDFGDVKKGATDANIDTVTNRNFKKNKFCVAAAPGGLPPPPPPPSRR